jgi:Arc/MetJ family transcription regulator
MRTNIDIDDDLLTEAMAATGLPTKKATVEEALRRMVTRHRRRAALADMAGLGWEGDLDAMREGRGGKPLP